MNHGVETILYPVKNLATAKKLFTRLLEVQPHVDQPYYVGYMLGNQEIGLVPNSGGQGMAGAVSYYTVSDIRQSIQGLLDDGAQKVEDLRDVGGGKLVAVLKDPDGNSIGLIQMP